MATDEEQYRETMAKAGVEVPEEETKEEPAEEAAKPKEEEKPAEPAPAAPKVEKPEEKEEKPLQEEKKDEQPQRKRTIYDDYKDRKEEVKTEKQRADAAEKDAADLRVKLAALESAKTTEEKKEATDDLEAFAKEIDADPEALRKMRELFLKDAPKNTQGISKEEYAKWEAWMSANQGTVEKSMFAEEFQATVPALKELFPKVSDTDLESIKTELDTLSHTKEYHDKPLDYVAFKERAKLSTLISPKTRGPESKGKVGGEEVTTDFDPNADLSKMSAKDRAAWEKTYREATKGDGGLTTNENGKKILL